ncbi:cation transporter [Candidatus Peregrinibacteria bacterium]|nr:cation transporter [Candidatus Peregrinibacteria bacterium]
MPTKQVLTKRQTHIKNLKSATIVVRNSLIMVIALTLIKAFGGYVTNIVSVMGDAVGSFSDIVALLGIYVGLKLSQKRATKNFEYGYHRVETLVSLLVSILILVAGYKILSESFSRFFIQVQTSSHGIGVAASIISIVLSLLSYFSQRKTAEDINSNALRASSLDKRNDTFVSLGVLISVVADKFRIPYVEGAVGLAIGILGLMVIRGG